MSFMFTGSQGMWKGRGRVIKTDALTSVSKVIQKTYRRAVGGSKWQESEQER